MHSFHTAAANPVGIAATGTRCSMGRDRRNDVLSALVRGLEAEFGCEAGAALAQRFLEAEEVDFLWQARRCERWIGRYEAGLESGFAISGGVADDAGDGDDEGSIDLDLVAVMGRLAGRWFTATLIVDGEGRPHGLVARRNFARADRARKAWSGTH